MPTNAAVDMTTFELSQGDVDVWGKLISLENYSFAFWFFKLLRF